PPMDRVETLHIGSWDHRADAGEQAVAIEALERGRVLFLPDLAFALESGEERFRSPEWSSGSSKNISYDPATGRIGGARAAGADAEALRAMLVRFAASARRLVDALLPAYRAHLVEARASFRPVQVAGRLSSWRKDDQRLHTDAYPSRPTRGARILRVFANVHPSEGRVWRVGQPFEDVAQKFLPALRPPRRGAGALLAALGITRGRRTPYDHLMLELHDGVKRDLGYQERAPQVVATFPPGSSWLVFTDQVLH